MAHSAPNQAGWVDDTGRRGPTRQGTAEQKAAADAALGWASTARKLSERLLKLTRAVEEARLAGVPPEVLNATLADAEWRADGGGLPAEVWHAAGLTSPRN